MLLLLQACEASLSLSFWVYRSIAIAKQNASSRLTAEIRRRFASSYLITIYTDSVREFQTGLFLVLFYFIFLYGSVFILSSSLLVFR